MELRCRIDRDINGAASTSSTKSSISRYTADAKLLAEFEQSEASGESFDYSKSVTSPPQSVPEEQISSYLSKIQRGGLIQPFGCIVCVEEPSFRVIAFSENAIEFIGLNTPTDDATTQFTSLLNFDARTFFTRSSGESLTKAAASPDISLFNPIWVYSKITQKPFYAVLHRIDVGIVIDLEPRRPRDDPAFSITGAVQSQKLAVQAITRLQAVPAGDVGMLCDTVVEDVQELTGYDRVMVYKFHEDDHGEIVSEIRRFDLEPYLGVHYPATDIPQAARFLFKQNRIRMICDCNATPVRIIQSEELDQPLCLVNSILRSPHDCHAKYMANMGSIASLVMAIVINNGDSMKLWGLVACHHSSLRNIPFPLRCACDFLIRAFGLQLNLELQLASQLVEKKILTMQASLCDMILKDGQLGIVSQSPNIMQLVKCDGAALYYDGRCHLIGVTPVEVEVKDIANWLLTYHQDSTGLSTDSLVNAGYPGAALLSDRVCGLASARISEKDFLFWFRCHAAKKFKWGGAKHHPDDRDNSGRMHPRLSFKVFLDVVKNRSFPWEIWEMNAIYSLQLILRDFANNIVESACKMMINDKGNNSEMDQLTLVASELVRLIETATTPIFAIDSNGLINAWNAKTSELTGLAANDVMGKSLVREVIDEKSCAIVEDIVARALNGEEVANVEFRLKIFKQKKENDVVSIQANTCVSKDDTERIVGVCFVGQDVSKHKVIMDKFVRLQGDYKAIIQSLDPLIPPIFSSDDNACCSEWNSAMEKLTGWKRDEVIGKMLAGEVFGNLCPLKGHNAVSKFMILLYQTLCNQNTGKCPLSFFDRNGKYVEVLMTATRRTNMQGNVIGCFCFLQQELELKMQQEKKSFSSLRHLAYIQQEVRTPLHGIKFVHDLLRPTVSDDMKQLLEISDVCQKQMMRIVEDTELGNIEVGSYLKLDIAQFLLKNVIDAILNQAVILATRNGVKLVQIIPEEIRGLSLYGDQIRLQQVLSDFLLQVVDYAPPDGWVEINITANPKQMQDRVELVHLNFRITHPGMGLPSKLIQGMYDEGTQEASQERLSIGLCLSRKLVERMNGHVRYFREPDKCYFVIHMEFHTDQT